MAGNRAITPSTLDEQFDFNAADLSKQFEQLLRTRQINELEAQARGQRSPSSHRSATPSSQSRTSQPSLPTQPTPPTYTSYRNTPLVPCAPQDAQSLKFRNLLLTLSVTPTKYENPGLLDEALEYVPIERIYISKLRRNTTS